MKTYKQTIIGYCFPCLAMFILNATSAFAANRTASQSGNWNDNATWGGLSFPVAGDNVTINVDYLSVTITANAACANITIGGAAVFDATYLIFGGSYTLTSTGTTTFTDGGQLSMDLGGTFISNNWAANGGNHGFAAGTGKVIFNGISFTLPDVAQIFYDLEIAAGANTVTLFDDTYLNNLTLTSGTLASANKAIFIAGDWTNSGGAFTEGTGTVTFNGTGTQTIAAGETFYNLTTSKTATSILALGTADITVSNVLNMTAGKYNLNGRTLILGTSGVASTLTRTASSTTNWMYGGTFKRFWLAGAISSTGAGYYGLFPMGTSAASTYRPFQINTTTNTTANGFFSVNHVNTSGALDLSPFYDDDPGAPVVNIERICNEQFLTTVSSVTGGVYDIAATMTDIAAIGNLSDIRLAVFTGGTTASARGTHAAATGTVANPTAQRTGVTQAELDLNNDFRVSTINAATTPLPVELLSFEAKYLSEQAGKNDFVQLSWTTASETNNEYFVIERSVDGSNFMPVDKIKGTGNSSTVRNYEFIDNELPTTASNTVFYYRLRQVDYNGQYSYSHVRSVELSTSGISIYPNPNSGIFQITIDNILPTGIGLEIYNMFGEKVFYSTIQQLVTLIDISTRPKGMYFYTIVSEGHPIASGKIVIRD